MDNVRRPGHADLTLNGFLRSSCTLTMVYGKCMAVKTITIDLGRTSDSARLGTVTFSRVIRRYLRRPAGALTYSRAAARGPQARPVNERHSLK